MSKKTIIRKLATLLGKVKEIMKTKEKSFISLLQNGKGIGQKSSKRVRTEQQVNAQIDKISRSVQISTEKELVARLDKKANDIKVFHITERLRKKREKNLEIIRNLEKEL